jgi:hypothetical protein
MAQVLLEVHDLQNFSVTTRMKIMSRLSVALLGVGHGASAGAGASSFADSVRLEKLVHHLG